MIASALARGKERKSRMNSPRILPASRGPRLVTAARLLAFALLVAALASLAGAQDQAYLGTITTSKKLSLALPDFVAAPGVPAAVPQTFNNVLWNDLYQCGLVNMVSKSMDPVAVPGQPSDLSAAALNNWTMPPAGAQRLVFGNIQIVGGKLQVEGFLYNLTQPDSPYMMGKRYTDQPTVASARIIAHQLADAIVAALGGGPGIASSKIAFISNRSGSEEVWIMDYDGANQTQLTHMGAGSIAYSPRISPDGSKIAFISYEGGGPQIHIISLLTHRYLPFPHLPYALVESPAWSPDGSKLAFAAGSSNVEIYTADANGHNVRQLTFDRGVNVSPVWNPKTGAQIAFVSNRGGLPAVYVMEADGTNQTSVTTGGYAVSPSWSPNGQVLAFAWVRSGGGENSGALDIYIYDLTAQKYVQLTHNEEHNDCPSWAPDGRHLVFQSGTPERTQLFTVLADGSNPAQLTTAGSNQMPNWSWH